MNSQVLVYGGCVSRDLFGVMFPGMKPKNYIARQSLISAATLPISPPEINLASEFQARMVASDFGSDLFSMFSDTPKETEMVLMDLLGERLGVLDLGCGKYLTHSNELVRSGVKDRLENFRLIPFGTEEHFNLWKISAIQLYKSLVQQGLIEKIYVINTPFADFDDCGNSIRKHMGKDKQEWADAYAPYYQLLESLNINILSIEDRLIVGSTAHKWGTAPYHYVPEAYENWANAIKSF